MVKKRTKTVITINVMVYVQQRDIEDGKCLLVAKCMHKIAIERALRKLDPTGGDHRTRLDGQLVKFRLDGYHYHSILPKLAKMNLMQFDKEKKARIRAERDGVKFVSKVEPHSYRLEAVRGAKIQPFTRERMEQIYAARNRRAAEGRPDKRKYDIRFRIEGLGPV